MESFQEENQQPKLPSIGLFRTLKKNFSILGINLNAETQLNPFNANIRTTVFALGLGIISTLTYIFNEAQTFFQFSQSIYICCACTDAILILLTCIVHSNELCKLFKNCEDFVNTGKHEHLNCFITTLELNAFSKYFSPQYFRIQIFRIASNLS